MSTVNTDRAAVLPDRLSIPKSVFDHGVEGDHLITENVAHAEQVAVAALDESVLLVVPSLMDVGRTPENGVPEGRIAAEAEGVGEGASFLDSARR